MMKQPLTNAHPSRPGAVTARDLMTPNPVSLHGGATIPEVLAFLADTGFSAAPIIDDAGRPIGVVSRTDIVVYDRARGALASGTPASVLRAADLMTPVVFSVGPDASAVEVAQEMARQNVHRLFVLENGTVVGVISALDLLRHFAAGG